MTAFTIELEGQAAARRLFRSKARFAGDFIRLAGREMLGAVKRDIAGEFQGQYYLAGGRRSWAPTVAFGRLRAGRPALRSFARRWQSAPPRVSSNAAEIRVSVPGSRAHVGGTGTTRQQRTTVIRPRRDPRLMQGAIYRKTGARISRRTLLGPGLRLPSRPHANPDNPVTARNVELVMASSFERA